MISDLTWVEEDEVEAEKHGGGGPARRRKTTAAVLRGGGRPRLLSGEAEEDSRRSGEAEDAVHFRLRMEAGAVELQAAPPASQSGDHGTLLRRPEGGKGAAVGRRPHLH